MTYAEMVDTVRSYIEKLDPIDGRAEALDCLSKIAEFIKIRLGHLAHSDALLNRYMNEVSRAQDTRTAAQVEATRQTLLAREFKAGLVEKLPAAVEAILDANERCAVCGSERDNDRTMYSHDNAPHVWEDADLVAVLREALGLGDTT